MDNLEWIAVYADGSILRQHEPDGTENRYEDIDRKRVSEFHLRLKGKDFTVIAYALDPGQRLIYRKRHSMSGITGEKNWTIHMVGWQQTVNGKNVQCISWVFPDGSIINTGRFRENHPVLYGVELLPFEEQEVVVDTDEVRE
jgi:hypothetical protein